MKSLHIEDVMGEDGKTYLLRVFDRGNDIMATAKKLTEDEINNNLQHTFISYANSPLDRVISAAKEEIKKISSE